MCKSMLITSLTLISIQLTKRLGYPLVKLIKLQSNATYGQALLEPFFYSLE